MAHGFCAGVHVTLRYRDQCQWLSISARDEAAIGLYESKLATEILEAELRDWLDDDSSWVRLMAASDLWDRTQAAEGTEVLSSIVDNEPVDSWSARLARRELTSIRAQHSQQTTFAPSSAGVHIARNLRGG